MVNDADAAGVAEMVYGAGRGQHGVVLMTTFGTGIGTAVFLHGQLLPNTEFGHIEIRRQGRREGGFGGRAREEGLELGEVGQAGRPLPAAPGSSLLARHHHHRRWRQPESRQVHLAAHREGDGRAGDPAERRGNRGSRRSQLGFRRRHPQRRSPRDQGTSPSSGRSPKRPANKAAPAKTAKKAPAKKTASTKTTASRTSASRTSAKAAAPAKATAKKVAAEADCGLANRYQGGVSRRRGGRGSGEATGHQARTGEEGDHLTHNAANPAHSTGVSRRLAQPFMARLGSHANPSGGHCARVACRPHFG